MLVAESTNDLQPEHVWLRYRLRMLRATLGFARDPSAKSLLKGLIRDAEDRIDLLEKRIRVEDLLKSYSGRDRAHPGL